LSYRKKSLERPGLSSGKRKAVVFEKKKRGVEIRESITILCHGKKAKQVQRGTPVIATRIPRKEYLNISSEEKRSFFGMRASSQSLEEASRRLLWKYLPEDPLTNRGSFFFVKRKEGKKLSLGKEADTFLYRDRRKRTFARKKKRQRPAGVKTRGLCEDRLKPPVIIADEKTAALVQRKKKIGRSRRRERGTG